MLLCATPVAADTLRLDWPMDCTLGESCFVQNYVDRDPGPAAADFACARRSYDGHKGTDIAVTDMAAMRDGVDVRAAAPGTVAAMRDGMPDILFTDPAAPDITNRSCGNAVIVDHEDGWQTRYCHMKNGSVQVRSGDIVAAGDVLGQVGLSGETEFPHLHLSVLQNGKITDPFQPGDAACGDTRNSLWADNVAYVAGGLVSAGFSATIPEYTSVKDGSAHAETLQGTAPALVIWGQVFGSQEGDSLEFEITGDSGQFLSQTVLLDRAQARLFRAVGRKRKNDPWPPGQYQGTVTLIRNGVAIDQMTTALRVTE